AIAMLQKRLYAITIAALLTAASIPAGILQAEERPSGPAAPDMGQAIGLQFEGEYLKLKTMQLDAVKAVAYEFLRQKKLQKLKETVAAVKAQRQTTQDFEGFFKWMSTNLAGYNRYIQASSYVAVAAKMLPVPYAGQASNFTKFVGQFTVAINKASLATTQYLSSSQKFIAMVEAINPATPLSDKALAEAHLFADQILLRDMNDAQKNLSAISNLSTGALSFLTGLSQFASETTGYWNKVKGLVKKDIDPKEKSYLSESINNLKIQAERFNGRFTVFEELAQKETALVKSLVVYDELAAEIGGMK
ncbi:MAG: hypothetical protein PHN75_20350, partial [Syntrophales bacterium]|nr:hypothetical protein [Syntrophales bacterium]